MLSFDFFSRHHRLRTRPHSRRGWRRRGGGSVRRRGQGHRAGHEPGQRVQDQGRQGSQEQCQRRSQRDHGAHHVVVQGLKNLEDWGKHLSRPRKNTINNKKMKKSEETLDINTCLVHLVLFKYTMWLSSLDFYILARFSDFGPEFSSGWTLPSFIL